MLFLELQHQSNGCSQLTPRSNQDQREGCLDEVESSDETIPAVEVQVVVQVR
jgi:hypothetical protein